MKAHVTSRKLVLDSLTAISAGASLDTCLPQLYSAPLSEQDKAFARQLLMMSLRHYGQLDAMLRPYLRKPMTGKLADAQQILVMGAAQLVLLETPAHAAIDTSVQLAKAEGFRHQSGLINAVLRKIAKESPALPPALQNVPSWLQKRWRNAYGKEALAQIAAQIAQEPPLDVQLKPGVAMEAGEALLPQMRRIANCNVTQIPGYEAGDFWVQDVAASVPVRLMGDVTGKRVLDACAAPGGKTLQLCAAGAEVVAVDRSPARLKRVEENLMRTGYSAECIAADLTHYSPGEPVDMVLLDAPCSATGTIRRHPDIFRRKREKDIQEMATLQRDILTQMMTWLPVGIPLLYCVCSLEPEEGEQQIDWLLSTYPDMQLTPLEMQKPELPAAWQPKAGILRLLPHYWSEQGGMDGFFIAHLVRS